MILHHRRTSRLPAPVQVVAAVAVMFISSFSPALIQLIPPVRDLVTDRTSLTAVIVSWPMRVLPLLVALLLVALLVRWDGGGGLRSAGWRRDRRSAPAAAVGLLLGTVAVVVAAVLVRLLGLAPVTSLSDADLLAGLPLAVLIITQLLTIVTQQAIPEELIFRGYLLRSLRTGTGTAVLISSIVFGLLHLVSLGGQQNAFERVVYLAMPLGFGALAAVLAVRFDSLWAGVGVHVGFHLGSRVAVLAGVGGGPWFWTICGLLFVAIAVTLWLAGQRRSGSPTAD